MTPDTFKRDIELGRGLAGPAAKVLETKQYRDFLREKSQSGQNLGFEPIWLPDFMFDFQRSLVEWSLRKGRSAIFADCGMGKTLMQLVWSENVVRHTGRPVLIVTPLAVSHQTVREAAKFQIEATRCNDGQHGSGIIVTNYERLHYFDPDNFAGMVCDESSILKNFDGATKESITAFMRHMKYRLLCTATAAPNDYIELGTSSEALGELGYMDMLSMFFKNDQNSLHPMSHQNKWRFKPHAQRPFWRWMCSWARALRKPSDLGFADDNFILPDMVVNQTIVNASRPMDGMLFVIPARGLAEQRQERKHTLNERCEAMADKLSTDDFAVAWCHLNAEADQLVKLIPDSEQVSGKDSDESKEAKFSAFSDGNLRVLVTKPRIGAFGLNWQHCSHMGFFPSHSFEQYYQGVRRCWRFGQQRPVFVDIISTEGEADVLSNLTRKAAAAELMFEMIVKEMSSEMSIDRSINFSMEATVPQWLLRQ